MTDDRQRLRRGAVEYAKAFRFNDEAPSILAMESLLVEAEAEIERWRVHSGHEWGDAESHGEPVKECARCGMLVRDPKKIHVICRAAEQMTP